VLTGPAQGVRSRIAILGTPLYVAVMIGNVSDFTALVLTVKVAVVAPAAMVTLAGTVAEELVLLSVTTTPPAGAGEAS